VRGCVEGHGEESMASASAPLQWRCCWGLWDSKWGAGGMVLRLGLRARTLTGVAGGVDGG